MAKISFTLDAWLKDKSQRVETRDGRIVYNIWSVKEPLVVNGKRAEVCALIDGEEDALLFFEGGKYLSVNSENPFDLFIVTPEEELSEWEKEVRLFSDACARRPNYVPSDGDIRIWAAELLELAKNEILRSDKWIIGNDALRLTYERGKAEALRTHATELTENIAKLGLDKHSIPYHLIEFMCNLYTCQNWKEIEETAEAYATRIKAIALKDLPRWKKDNSFETEGTFMGIKGRECFVVKDGYSISVAELIERLPGFKED